MPQGKEVVDARGGGGVRIPKFQHFMCNVVWHRIPPDTSLRFCGMFLYLYVETFNPYGRLAPLGDLHVMLGPQQGG